MPLLSSDFVGAKDGCYEPHKNHLIIYYIMEGSLEDNFRLMDRCSNSGESGQKRERVSRQKIKVREKGEKSQNTVFFQCFVALEGSKSRLAKAAGAEPSGRMRDPK